MTQFKDKSAKHANNVNVGLFSYPVLMAADILLYQADYVPIGEDQKQHLELARNIAERFNSVYSPTFTVPNPYIGKAGARVMSLQTPEKKMSKSDTNANGFISMLDTPDDIMRKFKRAVTDCEMAVKYDKVNKAGISNLLTIYCAATGCALHLIEPLGFDISEKAVRRAGLDYWQFLSLTVHKNYEDFLAAARGTLYFCTKLI